MSNTPNRRKKFMLVVFIIFSIIVCILSEKYKAPENTHSFSNCWFVKHMLHRA